MGSNVVCSTSIGNARVSVRGIDNSDDSTSFLCLRQRLGRTIKIEADMSIDSVEMLKEPCSGFTPIAIPVVKTTDEGVSVEYAPSPGKKWFVLRASYGRENMVADEMIRLGHYAYVAKRYEWVVIKDKRTRVLKSLIPNLMFVYLTEGDANTLVRNDKPKENPCPRISQIASFYYNHFKTDGVGKNPPIEVSERDMRNFILATWTHDENIIMPNDSEFHFLENEEVEVVDGPFKGVHGLVIRAKGQRRVMLRLLSTDGMPLIDHIATAFIPRSYMRKVEK